MEKWISREFGEAEVMIAWTEEPRVALKYMMEFGHHYNPDMVFLGITLSNDITQVYGGKPGIKYYEGLHNREVADDCLRKRNLWEEIGWVTNFVYTRLRFIGLFYDQPRAVSSRHNAYKKPKLFDTHHALGFFMNPPPKVIEDAYRELFLKISELKKILDDKGKEKNFPDNFMTDIYKVESQYLNQFTRSDAQKRIRQLLLSIIPEDKEELKKINESTEEKNES